MLYGRVLRSPKYRAKLTSVDLAPAKAMEGVVAVQDGEFVGVAAPTAFAAEQAIEAVAKTAKWEAEPMPSSDELYDYLRENADGGVPANPFADEVAKAAEVAAGDVHDRLRAARAAGAADGGGRMGRRQAHRVDGDAEPVRRARRAGAGVSTCRKMPCA